MRLKALIGIILISIVVVECIDTSAMEVAELQQENDSLEAKIVEIETKLNLIETTADSLYNFADSAITDLRIKNDTLLAENLRLETGLEDLLTRINNDIVNNIDSIYARIKRNYDNLLIE